MKNILYASLLMFAGFIAHAQKVSVFDNTTRETIPGVVVYSNSPALSAVTNEKGEVDVSSFKAADTIFFKYVGIDPVGFTYSQLEAMNFKVGLTETNISLNELVIASNRWEEKEIEV